MNNEGPGTEPIGAHPVQELQGASIAKELVLGLRDHRAGLALQLAGGLLGALLLAEPRRGVAEIVAVPRPSDDFIRHTVSLQPDRNERMAARIEEGGFSSVFEYARHAIRHEAV